MISSALLFDAIIGNVQEKEMKKHQASNAEIVLYSYFIGIFYILFYLLASGDFVPAFQICQDVSCKACVRNESAALHNIYFFRHAIKLPDMAEKSSSLQIKINT